MSAPNRNRGRRRGRGRGRNNEQTANEETTQSATVVQERPEGPITIGPVITVGELAELLKCSPVDVIKELMGMGIMATINQQIDFDAAEKVAEAFEVTVELREGDGANRGREQVEAAIGESASDPGAKERPPIVTIMGHVDHGKTKLLDAIRETRVEGTEAGGITQRIGAYQVEINRKKITFIDTPGHEAFTAMRARGAQATDIAILVVAADDGIMPQTREAIAHAKAADVPIIVAINKMDLPAANPDYVKQQLAEAEVVPEEYGGDVPVVEISAKEGQGIEDLLEVITLVAEILELRANPHTTAVGVVIEAELERTRGIKASLLVQSGTLQLRDIVVAGATYGRIRAMEDDQGRSVRRAGPSTPVVVYGLLEIPEAGDVFQVVEDEKTAREMANERRDQVRTQGFDQTRIKLDDFYTQVQKGEIKELPIVIKAESQGSLGAVQGSLAKLAEDMEDVALTTVHTGTGAITESDVNLAVASGAIIVGFNVRPDAAGRRLAEMENIDIRFYDVIYHLTDDIKAAMTGLLEPEQREETLGYAEVRDLFRLPNRLVVAGCYVTDGRITRNARARVLRNGVVTADTRIASLKRFKEDVREVQSGYECGLSLDGFNEFEIDDLIEAYEVTEVARS
ncbi:MAG: translation initiation factor IF-2 [Chloroflexota bacterium]